MKTEKEINDYIYKIFNFDDVELMSQYISIITNNDGSGILNLCHGLIYTVDILLEFKNWLNVKNLTLTTYPSGALFEWSL